MPVVPRNHPRLRNSRAGNAFAVCAMNLMLKFMPPAQRRRRRAFDSASKERRSNAGQQNLGFAFAELARALKCGPVRLFATGFNSSNVALGHLALPLHPVLDHGTQLNS